MTESLAGRFYLHRMTHLDYKETKERFDLSLDEWLSFEGYPGTLKYHEAETFWHDYVRDALIETVISRDILQMSSIHKPALLRDLFFLSALYPTHIFSYTKMLGQLVDSGNTTTLAHYLRLRSTAFFVTDLERYRPGGNPKRGSSPKLIVRNNGLINAVTGYSFIQTRNNIELWGRLVENAVDAFILIHFEGLPYDLYYWRHQNDEVDFVLTKQDQVWAIEVKSLRLKSPRGIRSFLKQNRL